MQQISKRKVSFSKQNQKSFRNFGQFRIGIGSKNDSYYLKLLGGSNVDHRHMFKSSGGPASRSLFSSCLVSQLQQLPYMSLASTVFLQLSMSSCLIGQNNCLKDKFLCFPQNTHRQICLHNLKMFRKREISNYTSNSVRACQFAVLQIITRWVTVTHSLY